MACALNLWITLMLGEEIGWKSIEESNMAMRPKAWGTDRKVGVIINQDRKQRSGAGLGTYVVKINLQVYLIEMSNSRKFESEN